MDFDFSELRGGPILPYILYATKMEPQIYDTIYSFFGCRFYWGGDFVKKASVTVEAAFLIPMLFMLISGTIMLIFYYHDKVVLQATAHETVTVLSENDEITEEMVESYFRETVEKRLLLFRTLSLDVNIESETLTLRCDSMRKRMRLEIEASMKRTDPEVWVRTKNKLVGEVF